MPILDFEKSAVEIFRWKVESLCWKVSDNINAVSSPKRQNSLLLDASSETVDDTVVFYFEFSIFMLSLEQKFDSFDRGSKCLGSDACKSSCEEIKEVEVVSSYLFGLGQVSIRHRN